MYDRLLPAFSDGSEFLLAQLPVHEGAVVELSRRLGGTGVRGSLLLEVLLALLAGQVPVAHLPALPQITRAKAAPCQSRSTDLVAN